ncbi:unnamed protein product [Adineta ricciae]|uniref:Apple domain-containing protein n=1 Tax=Adineta ricciae TaxID=249248 RepID=A0A814Z043_ADIRI|nr:unnamed protein product [Adineta ricciae]CAF1238203.1 unnamed protein product [Adineta ricciae]
MILIITASSTSFIRQTRVSITQQHAYIVNHIAHKIGFAIYARNVHSCIYICQNNDFCRTAVFDSQLLLCDLFEECSAQGQIVSDPNKILISFLLCNGEPDNVIFSSSSIQSIPMQTVMANLTLITHFPAASNTWCPFFINNLIYVPLENVVNVYETDTYTLVQTISIPVSSSLSYLRADSQGTLVYMQVNDSTIYIHSLNTNQINSINVSFTNTYLCYSNSFIVILSTWSSEADVYLRTFTNNSAVFLYRISGWGQIYHCVINNDQELIVTVSNVGFQMTMLSTTNYNSTITTIALNTTYLPTGAMLNLDAGGRLYAASNGSWQMSTAFSIDGRLIGTHTGTLDCVGMSSKYKFMLMTTDGSRVSLFEYKPQY